ncbi:hypothetical protein ACLOJK_018894 [Asimina triloba]
MHKSGGQPLLRPIHLAPSSGAWPTPPSAAGDPILNPIKQHLDDIKATFPARTHLDRTAATNPDRSNPQKSSPHPSSLAVSKAGRSPRLLHLAISSRSVFSSIQRPNGKACQPSSSRQCPADHGIWFDQHLDSDLAPTSISPSDVQAGDPRNPVPMSHLRRPQQGSTARRQQKGGSQKPIRSPPHGQQRSTSSRGQRPATIESRSLKLRPTQSSDADSIEQQQSMASNPRRSKVEIRTAIVRQPSRDAAHGPHFVHTARHTARLCCLKIQHDLARMDEAVSRRSAADSKDFIAETLKDKIPTIFISPAVDGSKVGLRNRNPTEQHLFQSVNWQPSSRAETHLWRMARWVALLLLYSANLSSKQMQQRATADRLAVVTNDDSMADHLLSIKSTTTSQNQVIISVP